METGDEYSIPFIVVTENHDFKITEEAKEFLNSLNSPNLGVISIVGKYRTGKSYFINKVLLDLPKKKGFAVGPTINPCTKGIWLWKKLLNAKDFGADEDMDVLIMDTEGFGGIDENVNHDTRIFLFSILLSSFFIYNSVGSIDESALQSLSLIVNLAKDIKIKNKGDNTDEEIRENFPTFLWVIRDFVLSLEDRNGEKLTSKKYLENALSFQNGVSETVENKNKIRKMLKYFFQERDCVTLVRPVETERDLKRLDVLDEKYLRSEFLEQIKSIRRKIYKRVKPKFIGSKKLSTSMLLDAAAAYVGAINKGSVPNIENAWTYICEEESQKAFQNTLKSIPSVLNEFEQKGVHFGNTDNFLSIVKKKLLQDFKSKVIGDEHKYSVHAEKLEIEIEKKLKQIIDEKKYHISKLLEKEFDTKYFILRQKLTQNEIKDYKEALKYLNMIKSEICEDNDKLKNKIITDLIGQREKEVLNMLLENKTKVEEKIKEAEIEAKSKLTEVNTNLEELNKLLEKKEKEILELKDKVKELKEELREYKVSNKELENNLREQVKERQEKESSFIEWKKTELSNFEKNSNKILQKYEKENSLLEKKKMDLEKEVILSNQKIDLLQKELNRKDQQGKEISKECDELRNQLNNYKKLSLDCSSIDTDTVINLRSNIIKYEKEIIEFKMKNQYLEDQIDFLKSQNVEMKNIYEKFLFNFQPKRNENESLNSDLLSTNKILSSSLEKSQSKIKLLEEQINYFKQFKKIIKYANSVQCFKCFRDLNPASFLEHIQQCKSNKTKKTEKNNNTNYNKVSVNYEYPKETTEDFKNAIKSSIIETEDIFVKIDETIVNNTNKHPFIQYCIMVNSKSKPNRGVKRRYTEFCNLYNDILEQFPGIVLPKSALLFQSCNYQVSSINKQEPLLEERKKSLEKFINDLLKINKIRFSQLLKEFLEMDEPMKDFCFDKEKQDESEIYSKSNMYQFERNFHDNYETNQRNYQNKEIIPHCEDDNEEIFKIGKFGKMGNYTSSKKKLSKKFSKYQ